MRFNIEKGAMKRFWLHITKSIHRVTSVWTQACEEKMLINRFLRGTKCFEDLLLCLFVCLPKKKNIVFKLRHWKRYTLLFWRNNTFSYLKKKIMSGRRRKCDKFSFSFIFTILKSYQVYNSKTLMITLTMVFRCEIQIND